MTIKRRIAVAKEAATAGVQLALKLQADSLKISHKGPIDLVTNADKAVEKEVIRRIQEAFPGEAVMAEESGERQDRDGTGVWIIDPIDGTTNYAHGHPHWSISIAWAREGTVMVGAVGDCWGTCYWAVKDQGAFFETVQLQVSETRDLQHSLLVTGFPYNIAEKSDSLFETFGRLTKATQGVRRTGSAALDLCMVARGAFDGYWENQVQPWDVAAGLLLVKEAGGTVSDVQGRPWTMDSRSILASNSYLHGTLRDEVNRSSQTGTAASGGKGAND